MSSWTRGVVAFAALALLAGCGDDAPELHAADMSAEDAQACRDFVAALPDTLAGQDAVEVEGDTEYGAAWGDPAIVLTCGVPQPSDFTNTSTCLETAGVGWYVPDDVLLSDDESRDVTMTAVGYRPRVQVLLPGEYRPDGFPNTGAAIGAVVDRDLKLVRRCR